MTRLIVLSGKIEKIEHELIKTIYQVNQKKMDCIIMTFYCR